MWPTSRCSPHPSNRSVFPLGSEGRPTRPRLASPGRLVSSRVLPVPADISPLSVLACMCPLARRSKPLHPTFKQLREASKLPIAPLVTPCTTPPHLQPHLLTRCSSIATPSRISVSVSRKRRLRRSPATPSSIRLSSFEDLHVRTPTPALLRAR